MIASRLQINAEVGYQSRQKLIDSDDETKIAEDTLISLGHSSFGPVTLKGIRVSGTRAKPDQRSNPLPDPVPDQRNEPRSEGDEKRRALEKELDTTRKEKRVLQQVMLRMQKLSLQNPDIEVAKDEERVFCEAICLELRRHYLEISHDAESSFETHLLQIKAEAFKEAADAIMYDRSEFQDEETEKDTDTQSE